MAQSVRLCVLGDEITLGAGDERSLGWLGRVMSRVQRNVPIYVMPLGLPGDTSSTLLDRWEKECFPRFSNTSENKLVINLGVGDITQGISSTRSRLNLANILDSVSAYDIDIFVVGPCALPYIDQHALQELSAGYQNVCERRSIKYVDTFTPLREHDQWLTDFNVGDGLHPGQTGYGLLAWLVLHYGWCEWMGSETSIENI
ncbi:lysophospholipase [Actinomyces sp. zg-332]|uniref:GDSL-type esterase/lipase family protein n=1 Tax=Actinomyces sp. zg-332 TaxID=2708340 RepID=UPI00141D79F3|nr:GDSL-type esterase/lipase family protein [Actinomyces sp. zg-332]QPK94398.1 lysophospholipase [Actinomyces sp. zg-332]